MVKFILIISLFTDYKLLINFFASLAMPIAVINFLIAFVAALSSAIPDLIIKTVLFLEVGIAIDFAWSFTCINFFQRMLMLDFLLNVASLTETEVFTLRT
jgi:hypothetical protein